MQIEQARWGYVVLAFIQAALTAGVIFGWNELQAIFIDEHVYFDHCAKDDKDVPCEAQRIFFSMIFTVGVFSNNAAPLLTGIFLDKFGPKLTSLVSVLIFMCGCGLFMLKSAHAYPPAFALLGFSGPGVYVAIMHLNNLYPGHQATVLSFFSGTFTVSTFVFKVFRLLHSQREWFTMSHLFGCYILLLVPFFLVGGIFWPNKPFALTEKKTKDEESEKEILIPKAATPSSPLYGASLKAQITAPELWLIIMWMAVSNLHISAYLGTISTQYPTGNYASVFNWIWEFGFIAIPLFGLILDYFGILFAIFISNVGLWLFSIIVLIPVPELHYVGFVLVSTVNVGIWGIYYTFLSKTFGFNNYGKLLGVGCATIAVIGAIQYGLVWITEKKLASNYFWVNVFLAILQTLVFASPFFLWRREKMSKRISRSAINTTM